MPELNLHLVPYADDPLESVAAFITQHYQTSLPILDQVTCLLIDRSASARLRQQLLQKVPDYGALLGPSITTLKDWLSRFTPTDLNICNKITQELILIEALLEQKHRFSSVNPWVYARSLLQLFHELTLNKISLPASQEDFIPRIATAYGLSEADIHDLPALNQEAGFIYTLWKAWHTQLKDEGFIDTEAAYLLALNHCIEAIAPDTHLILIGYDTLNNAEAEWLRTLSSKINIDVFLHGQTTATTHSCHPDLHITNTLKQLDIETIPLTTNTTPITELLNTVYDTHEQPFIERIACYRNKNTPSPLINRLHIFAANDAEQEARAVDIQIRRWLHEGKQNLGIVTENRRMARRVRALLERSGIDIQDAAGWALSTTRSATTVERWLECIEQNFAYLPLLDILKSPFIFPDLERQTLSYAVYRLEQDIIRHENISQGLSQYRQAINDRYQRLGWLPQTRTVLLDILTRLETAATTLNKLLRTKQYKPQQFINTLLESLAQLGITDTFNQDAAGIEIITLLEQLQIDAVPVQLELSWTDVRSWLAEQLEQSRFMPTSQQQGIQLMGLAQSRYQKFDGLIIAAVEEEFLPGPGQSSPFFNDAVKHELGLVTTLAQKNERFYHFRRLLQSSEQLLMTYRETQQSGDPVKPASWLTLLHEFHQFTFAKNLFDETLLRLVNYYPNTPTYLTTHPLTVSQQPVPVLPNALVPEKITAYDYQMIMDCPYQYFAARCLGLNPPDEIREALSKAEFGSRVHLCLQAFHYDEADLPGPFRTKLTEQNRDAALKVLHAIIDAVFKFDLDENHEHVAWHQLCKKIAANYIDWQIQHNQSWSIQSVEQKLTTQLPLKDAHHLTLSGRIDRVDSNDVGLDIIDYKTGTIKNKKDILNGEQVQLPFYYILSAASPVTSKQPVNQVEYLKLEKDRVQTKCTLKDTELTELAEQSRQRLGEIFNALYAQKALPAWPDTKTCTHCNVQGICRQQMWRDDL